MIAQLTGTLATATLNTAVVDVAGVGYLIHTTPRALAGMRQGDTATFHTSLVVREDSLTLFGFDAPRDRETFEVLVSVQGIGPKIALAILAVHESEAVARAAHNEDIKAFTQVPGIGPKGAQRIVLELKGKLVPTGEDGQAPTVEAPGEAEDERLAQVTEALVGLGWSDKDAGKAVKATIKAQPELEDAPMPQVLRSVLSGIGRGLGSKAGR
ncbi:MAG: Holliday junction branch migration protein RuvA [Galactobacter sp.]|uniref:Holliday junction branch migration protein RuvA n=1 Tax=Galactobacter sp. TaxID=2676125 RepID=UPI0025BE0FFB|nr:Holliday junction branch migration protein RuvA [Galactobacter sp.]